MRNLQRLLLALGALLVLAGAQQSAPPAAKPQPSASSSASVQLPPPRLPRRGSALDFWNDYRPLPPLVLPGANPWVLTMAERTGRLPLSLRQAVQLTLADNLNLLADNYERVIAQIEMLRTAGGGAARGIAGAAISNSLFSGAIGASNAGGGGNNSNGSGGFLGGGSLFIPGGGSYDPAVSMSAYSIHSRSPLNSPALLGVPVAVENDQGFNFNYSQAFSTGTSFGIGVFGSRSFVNSNELFYNPNVSTTLAIGFYQPLLKGFGAAANRGFIDTAQNETVIAAAIFRQKVLQRAAAAADRYWKLVEAQRLAALASSAAAASQQLVADTRQLVAAGRKPESDLIKAQAALAQARQAELDAQTNAGTSGMKLALHLSRRLSPALLSAQIVTLNPLPHRTAFSRLPAGDPAPTLAQIVQQAVANSPALAQARLELANDGIALASTRNALLPSFGVGGSYATTGLSGMQLNCAVPQFPCPNGDLLPRRAGGVLQSLTQSLHANYPDYGLGFSLSFHVLNREARADHARAAVEYAQQRLRYRARQNQVAQQAAAAYLAWRNSALALRQAGDQYRLARRTYAGARYTYAHGRASILDVLTAAQAENQAAVADAAARLAYARAQDQLDLQTGAILARFAIHIRPLPPPRAGR